MPKHPLNNPVQEFFDHDACRYAEFFLPRKSGRGMLFQTRLALARQLSQGCAGSMLDCATGTGEISAAIYASGQFCEATFVDISSEMLRRTQLHLTSSPGHTVEFVRGDIFNYLASLESGVKFDLVVCLGLIAHTGRLEKLLHNFRAHLADGGRVLLQTSLLDHWGNRLWHLILGRRATKRHGYAFSWYTQRQITLAAENAQLAVLSIHRYGVGIPFIEKALPWVNYQFEVGFRNWASRKGAEAICVLGKPARP